MRIKHNQLDGLFAYKPIPVTALFGSWFLLRITGCLGTVLLSFFFNKKLLKWGIFQLASTLSFLVNKELFLKFTSLSVLVTMITEILTRSMAFRKCSSALDCNVEVAFIFLGTVYCVSSVAVFYNMFTARKKMK